MKQIETSINKTSIQVPVLNKFKKKINTKIIDQETIQMIIKQKIDLFADKYTDLGMKNPLKWLLKQETIHLLNLNHTGCFAKM